MNGERMDRRRERRSSNFASVRRRKRGNEQMTRGGRLALATLFSSLAAPWPASAQTAPPDAPAPSADAPPLAPICTDRPTKSTAPCTVDEGRFQYESDLFNATFLNLDGVSTDTFLFTNPTLKFGVSKSMDVEANIAPYEEVRTRGKDGATTTLGGVGDLYLRLKDELFQSPNGKLQIAIVPYLKAPTARLGIGDGAVEGGEVTSISYKLTDKLTLLTVPEFDDLADAPGAPRHFDTSQIVNLGYDLPHNLEVYGEIWSEWNFDPAGVIRERSADIALQWGVTRKLQLDGGLNFGLTKATPGVQAYVGASQKF
jgi:hypothetical protein